MKDFCSTVLGVSSQPHDSHLFRTRWERHLRQVQGGAFGRERVELQDELLPSVRKNQNHKRTMNNRKSQTPS